jgi:cytochrome c biogenesis protein CcmG/thiol:disulfide interchange protein DsbE
MKVRRRYLRVILCFAALACASLGAAAEPALDQAAPDFQGVTADGKSVSLADFKGQVLLLDFWAPSCTPCKQQLPLLDSYYRLQKKFGLQVLAVTTGPSASMRQLKRVAAELAIPVVRRFKGDYGSIQSVPIYYVIDRAGVLRYAKATVLTLDDMNTLLIPLLREQKSPEIEIRSPSNERTMNGS